MSAHEQLIAELATHVYWWWEVDKRCEPETRLWRYMDFAKFVAMLEHRSIYFARADMLDDPFEGASGYLDFFRRAVSTAPDQKEPPSSEHVEQEAARLLREFQFNWRAGPSAHLRQLLACEHGRI
jgi:hypothetical protein